MPKMRTHRGAAKRFSVTAGGKVKFKHAHLRHFLEHKAKSCKNGLQKTGIIADVDAHHIIALLRGV